MKTKDSIKLLSEISDHKNEILRLEMQIRDINCQINIARNNVLSKHHLMMLSAKDNITNNTREKKNNY